MGVVRDKSGSGGGVVPGEEVGAAGEWSPGSEGPTSVWRDQDAAKQVKSAS